MALHAARRLGRADDDHAVAGLDRLLPARDDHPVAPDDARDLGVRGDHRAPQGLADDLVGLGSDRHVELDHEHLTLGEDVGLPRSRNSDDARDRIRRLELGRDDEVDVELALPPDFEVLDVLRPDDRSSTGREPFGEDAGDDVDLVTGGARDHEVGSDNPCLLENAAARTVTLERQDLVPVGERAELGRIGIDHGDRVLAVERLDDGRPDLACPDDEDLHRRRLCIISAMQFRTRQ